MLLFGMFLFIAFTPRQEQGKTSRRRRHLHPGSFIAIGIALGLLGLVSVRYIEHRPARMEPQPPAAAVLAIPATPAIRPPIRVERQISPPGSVLEAVRETPPAETATIVERPASVQPIEMTEFVYHDGGKLVSRKTVPALPEWISQPRMTVANQKTTLVLHSERFATTQEAQQQLWQSLRPVLAADLAETYPASAGWSFALEDARQAGLVEKECDVVWPLEVGRFAEPVHQVHWQIKIADPGRAALYAATRPAAIQERLVHLALAIGAITLLLGAAAFHVRRRTETPC
jgi:hypothetical protein